MPLKTPLAMAATFLHLALAGCGASSAPPGPANEGETHATSGISHSGSDGNAEPITAGGDPASEGSTGSGGSGTDSGADATDPFCGDSLCRTGENCASCPVDCGDCPPACGDGSCGTSESCETCPGDCGQCPTDCGDGRYHADEDCESCPADGSDCPPACGDASCTGNETCDSCPTDCGPCTCGNDACNTAETCDSCPTDCGLCPTSCADAICNGAENCSSCPQDCGCDPPNTCNAGACAPSPNLFTMELDGVIVSQNVTYEGYALLGEADAVLPAQARHLHVNVDDPDNAGPISASCSAGQPLGLPAGVYFDANTLDAFYAELGDLPNAWRNHFFTTCGATADYSVESMEVVISSVSSTFIAGNADVVVAGVGETAGHTLHIHSIFEVPL